MTKQPINYVQEISALIRACQRDTGVMMTDIIISWMSDGPKYDQRFTLVDVEVTSKLGKPDEAGTDPE